MLGIAAEMACSRQGCRGPSQGDAHETMRWLRKIAWPICMLAPVRMQSRLVAEIAWPFCMQSRLVAEIAWPFCMQNRLLAEIAWPFSMLLGLYWGNRCARMYVRMQARVSQHSRTDALECRKRLGKRTGRGEEIASV